MRCRSELEAVLVDLDGTLVDRDAALRRWVVLNVDDERGRRAVLADLDDASAAGSPSLERVAVTILGPGRETEAEALARRIRAELPGLLRPDEVVLAALDRLAAAGLTLVLVSNGGGKTQRAKLAAAGIEVGRFARLLISAEIGVAKPDPRIFAAALAGLGGARAGAWMIGDRPEDDIVGAQVAGLSSCWIAQTRTWTLSAPPPTLTAPDFPAAVDALLAGRPIDTADARR